MSEHPDEATQIRAKEDEIHKRNHKTAEKGAATRTGADGECATFELER